MFKLMNKKREDRLREFSSIYYFIKKEWIPVVMVSKFATPYNIPLIPNYKADDTFKPYFLYTCYMNLYTDTLEIDSLKYTEDSRKFLFLQPDLNYLCLTMAIEKAIEMAKWKKKSKLIFSSNIDHTSEILLDCGFKSLFTYPDNNNQKGVLLINNNKEKYANN